MYGRYGFGRHPFAWATVIFLLVVYGIFLWVAVTRNEPITVNGVIRMWPMHLVLALSLVAIFSGRSR